MKLKIGNIIIFVLGLAFLIIVLILRTNIQLMFKGYKFKDTFKINELKLTDEVLKRDFNKTFDAIIKTDNFNKDYFDEYYKIDYLEDDKFIDNITKLLNNYKSDKINIILKKDQKTIDYVIDNDIKDFDKYLEYNFYKDEYLDRYIKYFNGDYKDTIVKVNIGLDKEYYVDTVKVDKYNTSIIVNKHNELTDSFKPKEITLLDHCSSGENYLAKEAKLAYDELCEASKKDGMQLGVNSSYRSHENQKSLYDSYLKLYGQNYVNKYVSVPGCSEHETGLALDVKSLKSDVFANSKEYTWMLENAYKYGFILRYPKDKEKITGYSYEAWHYRYVGKEIANYIKENNITFEEYKAMFD